MCLRGSGWVLRCRNFAAIRHWKGNSQRTAFHVARCLADRSSSRLAVGLFAHGELHGCHARPKKREAELRNALPVSAGLTWPDATRFYECRTLLTSRGWKRSSCRLIGKRTHIVPVAVVLRIFEATENIEALESEHDALLLEACRNSEQLEKMFLSVFMVCTCLYNRKVEIQLVQLPRLKRRNKRPRTGSKLLYS